LRRDINSCYSVVSVLPGHCMRVNVIVGIHRCKVENFQMCHHTRVQKSTIIFSHTRKVKVKKRKVMPVDIYKLISAVVALSECHKNFLMQSC